MSLTGSTTAHRKKILFIRSPQHSLAMVEKYLIKRDVTVFNEDNLREATQIAEQMKPDYIFIAIDHVDPQIEALYNYLLLKENTVVIPYIVSAHSKDILKLMQAQSVCQIKITPPLTGPSILRTISQYEKENSLFSKSPSPFLVQGDSSLKSSRFVLNSENENSTRVQFKSQLDSPKESLILNSPLKPYKQKPFSEEQKLQINSFFNKFIKANLEQDLIRITKERHLDTHPLTSGYTLVIECPGFSGAFLFTSKYKFTLSDIESHLQKFAGGVAELVSESPESLNQSKLFEVKLTEIGDLNAIDLNSSYNTTVGDQDLKSSINFYNLENSPFSAALRSKENNYLRLDPSLIRVNSVITFDIYFELKQNKKFLRYLKDGETITTELLNKINSAPYLYTNPENEYSWYEYAMRAFIANAAAKKAESE